MNITVNRHKQRQHIPPPVVAALADLALCCTQEAFRADDQEIQVICRISFPRTRFGLVHRPKRHHRIRALPRHSLRTLLLGAGEEWHVVYLGGCRSDKLFLRVSVVII